MSLIWWRDVAITVAGLGTIIALVVVAVQLLMVYRRVKSAQSSLNRILTATGLTSMAGSRAVKPMVEAMVLAQGVRLGMDMIRSVLGGREGGERE